MIYLLWLVRGHHVNQTKWEEKVDSELKGWHKTRPGALVEHQYSIVLKHKDMNVRHVTNFLSEIIYFYLKHGGDLLVIIIVKK